MLLHLCNCPELEGSNFASRHCCNSLTRLLEPQKLLVVARLRIAALTSLCKSPFLLRDCEHGDGRDGLM
jgi:hypothetical protein